MSPVNVILSGNRIVTIPHQFIYGLQPASGTIPHAQIVAVLTLLTAGATSALPLYLPDDGSACGIAAGERLSAGGLFLQEGMFDLAAQGKSEDVLAAPD
ncbi:hypothetical protein ACXDTH_005065 [Klebsiella variicola]|uniref:hypothetical protein n=1 Tax=Klebsiella variicola TaxID=244366 RepID=UPI000D749497|nr:hypothetical protein [Klebsiella variicola]PXL02062.1 hypothetical protein DMS22_23955 [Klebsiella variicola]